VDSRRVDVASCGTLRSGPQPNDARYSSITERHNAGGNDENV